MRPTLRCWPLRRPTLAKMLTVAPPPMASCGERRLSLHLSDLICNDGAEAGHLVPGEMLGQCGKAGFGQHQLASCKACI